MDIIYLKGLQVQTKIGAYAYEKAMYQQLTVDIQCQFDFIRPKTDDIEDAPLDYHQLALWVSSFFEKHHFVLLEAAADQFAMKLLEKFSCESVKVALEKKGSIKGVGGVGVVVERSKGDI